jgi:nitrite reductase (NADH) small subunit
MTTMVTSDRQALEVPAAQWLPVCRYEQLVPERGVAVLLDDRQIALFRTFDGSLYALDQEDPFTGAFVLARGIVGSRGQVPTVASPLYKQVFDLRTGACLDDPTVTVVSYPVRNRDGVVEVKVTDVMTTDVMTTGVVVTEMVVTEVMTE